MVVVESDCTFANKSKFAFSSTFCIYNPKNLHMNKKLLSLLFLAPGICVAQSEVYKVMGFAPSLDQVAVQSKDDASHDVALAFTRNGGWYADAKENEVGVARNNTPQFRIIRTATAGIYKLYSVKNKKFVAYTNEGVGPNKTKFVDDENDAQTNWLLVPNIGDLGKTNNFDIFPGSVSSPNGDTPAWNAFGGANDGARIGHWPAKDNGSCWSIEVPTQELKFYDSYSENNVSYFMTIRENYVHKEGDNFTADKNLEFGDKKYLFQLVGKHDNFRIYNAETGKPIGTQVAAGLNKNDKEDNNRYRVDQESSFFAQSYGGRVYVKETRGSNIYLNFRDNYLSTWNHAAAWSSRDPGSQILFATEDVILADAAKKLAEQIKTNYPAEKFGKDLNQYPLGAKGNLAEILKGLETAQDLKDFNITEKKGKYSDAKDFVEYLQFNMPQDGDLLYLSFERKPNVKYLTSTVHVDGDKDYDGKSSAGFLATKDAKTNDAVFCHKFENGKSVLISVATGRRVTFATRADGNVYYPTMQTKDGEGAGFSLSSRDGKYVFETEKKQGEEKVKHYLASDANMDYALSYGSFSPFAGIRLERVAEKLPVVIGPSGYSSFWCPFEYTVPQGVTACRLEVVDGKVKLSPIEGNVPKNTAVFLKGDANAKVELTLVPEGKTPALTNNLLKGGAVPTALATPVYALKKDGGFIKVKDYMPAFKAYFTATESQVRELLERGLTGVVSVATQAEDAPIYDLSGRRVQHTTKGGVYVVNGKKFIAK